MKFSIIVGESSTDGTVMYGDRIYGERNFVSNAPTDKWEHVWAVRYDLSLIHISEPTRPY